MNEVTYDALKKRVAELEAIIREKVVEIETAYQHEGECTECHWVVRAWGSKEHRDDCWYVKARAAVVGPGGTIFHNCTVTNTAR
jgi:hypothetical protein